MNVSDPRPAERRARVATAVSFVLALVASAWAFFQDPDGLLLAIMLVPVAVSALPLLRTGKAQALRVAVAIFLAGWVVLMFFFWGIVLVPSLIAAVAAAALGYEGRPAPWAVGLLAAVGVALLIAAAWALFVSFA